MFERISIERARDSLTIKALAKKANMRYETLLAKLGGHSEFTRSEMLRLQRAFSLRVPLDELFVSKNENNTENAS